MSNEKILKILHDNNIHTEEKIVNLIGLSNELVGQTKFSIMRKIENIILSNTELSAFDSDDNEIISDMATEIYDFYRNKYPKEYVVEKFKTREIDNMVEYFKNLNIEIEYVGRSGYTGIENAEGRLEDSDVIIIKFKNYKYSNMHVYHWNHVEQRYFLIYNEEK